MITSSHLPQPEFCKIAKCTSILFAPFPVPFPFLIFSRILLSRAQLPPTPIPLWLCAVFGFPPFPSLPRCGIFARIHFGQLATLAVPIAKKWCAPIARRWSPPGTCQHCQPPVLLLLNYSLVAGNGAENTFIRKWTANADTGP